MFQQWRSKAECLNFYSIIYSTLAPIERNRLSSSCLSSFLNIFCMLYLRGSSTLAGAIPLLPIAFPMMLRFGLMKTVSWNCTTKDAFIFPFTLRVSHKNHSLLHRTNTTIRRLDCLHHVANEAFCFDDLLSSSSVNTDICAINDLLHFTPSS